MTTTTELCSRHNDSVFDVVVIGGGQSGLAIGRQLQQRGRSFLIVDAGPETGHVWRSRWDSLTLFTAARYSGLPGLPFPGDPDSYPTKDAVAQYLHHYATTFGLPIRHNTRVTRVTRDGAGFSVHTDGETFHAAQVVVATGPFQIPVIPAVADAIGPDIVQLHSSGVPQPRTAPRRAGPGRRRRQLRCADRGRTAPNPARHPRERICHPLTAATDSGPRPVLVAHHNGLVHRTGGVPVGPAIPEQRRAGHRDQHPAAGQGRCHRAPPGHRHRRHHGDLRRRRHDHPGRHRVGHRIPLRLLLHRHHRRHRSLPAHRSTSAGSAPSPACTSSACPGSTPGDRRCSASSAPTPHTSPTTLRPHPPPHRCLLPDAAPPLIPAISPARPEPAPTKTQAIRFQVRRPVMSLHHSSIQDTACTATGVRPPTATMPRRSQPSVPP